MEPDACCGQERLVNVPADFVDPAPPGPFSLEDLYERHARSLYRYVARRLGDDLAEDLTAQVFVEALTHQQNFDPAKGSEVAWLYGIATNLIRRHHRRETRANVAHARLEAHRVTEDLNAPSESRLAAEADWARVAGVLADLSATDRDILLLYAWAELPYEAIAQAVGLPIGTVKSRINRARAKLRHRLDRGGEVGA